MTTRLLLMMLVVTVSGCGDGLDRYEGQWYSGFADRDETGAQATTAYRLTIDDEHRYQFAYRWSREEEWRDGSSGTINPTTVQYNGTERAGIDLGTSYAVLGGSKLNVMIGGRLRTFRRRGQMSGCMLIFGIVAIAIWLGGWLRERLAT